MKRIKLFLGILTFGLLFNITNVNAETISESKELTLTEDITEIVTVDNGANVTINLNGHDIRTAGNGALRVSDGAKVTIIGEGTIESTNDNGVVVSNGSTLILESGNIKSVEFGVFVTNDSTFTMNGGTITTIDNCGAGGNGNNTAEYKNYTININGGTINANIKTGGYVSCGIYHPSEGTVNITGGTINSSNGAGVVQRGGTLNITGGTINTSGSSVGKVGDSRVVVTASAVVVDKEANYPAVDTIVTKISKDAVLNGAAGSIETIGENIAIELTGGIFTEEPEEEQIPEGYNAYKILEGENKDKYVIANVDEIVNEVANAMITKEDVAEDTVALIEETVEGKYNLLSFYDVSLITVTENDDVIGYVTESENAVKVTLGLPGEMPELKEGFLRKYYVVRIHNGEATVISDVTDNGDGTVSFNSDKFSTYAIAYVDVEEEKTTSNPQTGDNIISNTMILLISLTGIVGTSLTIRKRFN